RHSCLPVMMLLAAALIMRAVLPSGWMPVAGQDGVRILLCSGQGPVATTLPLAGKRGGNGQDQDTAKDVCPFATVLQPFDLAGEPVPEIAQAMPPALTGAALAEVRLVIWRSLRPPARGPPALA